MSNFSCHPIEMKTPRTSDEDNDRRWAVAKTLPKNLIADPVQGLERHRLRRHLPSRFSVRAESRDGNTLTRLLDCVLKVFSRVYRVTGVLLYLTSRRGNLKEKGRRVTPRVGQHSPSYAMSQPALAESCHESVS